MSIDYTIGVDISKDNLDVFRLPDKSFMQFSNNSSGFMAMIDWLGGVSVSRIVYEATGAYHRSFERALAKADFALCKINPRQARRFAEATGKLAKTDKVDAMMLARFGETLEPKTRLPVNQVIDEMKDFILARRALIKARTSAKNQDGQLRSPLLKEQNAQRLAQINAQLKEIDAHLMALARADQTLKEQLDILLSIKGIAEITAISLLTDMPELGQIDNKQVAALAGLAPITRQSGRWKGRAHIGGGRSQVRHDLYMPALVAARFNPDLKAKYQALIKAGKPAKVALTAVMRKLIIIANACIRDKRKWTHLTA